MKNLIFILTFFAAGTLAVFAAKPTGTYKDENGDSGNFSDLITEYTGDYYQLTLTSGTYSNVKIGVTYPNPILVYLKEGVVFDGLSLNSSGSNLSAFYAYAGTTLKGEISFVSCYADIYSTLSSGTSFSVNGRAICFYSNTWQIDEVDLGQALVSGTGTVKMSAEDTFTLDFVSEELLKQTQTITLVADTATVSSKFKDIAITVGGEAVTEYIATQSADGRTISIKSVPEPSMFGLVAGTLALALAGTRRRRRK